MGCYFKDGDTWQEVILFASVNKTDKVLVEMGGDISDVERPC